MNREGLTKQITEIVEGIVKEEIDNKDLDKKISYYWIISEEILKNISIVKKQDR